MDFELYGIGAVALCIAIVELAKRLGFPEKYAPGLAVVIGIVEGLLAFGAADLAQSIVLGVAAGLSAVGLWSGIKNIGEGMKDETHRD